MVNYNLNKNKGEIEGKIKILHKLKVFKTSIKWAFKSEILS